MSDESIRTAETNGDVSQALAEKARAGLPGGRVYLTGHIDAASAHIAAGYPYGRGKCLRRTWIEEKPRQGFRFVYQTSKPYYPESGDAVPAPSAVRWNKPHASTYQRVMVLFLDEKNHIDTDVLGGWNPRPDAETNPESDIDTFVARAGVSIGKREEDAIKVLRLLRRVGSRIKYTVSTDDRPFPRTPEEIAARKAEDDEKKALETKYTRALIANESAKMDGRGVPFPSLETPPAPDPWDKPFEHPTGPANGREIDAAIEERHAAIAAEASRASDGTS